MSKRRVVITGISSICSIGKNTTEVWNNVVNCQSGIGPVTVTDMSNIRFKNGAEVKNYNPTDYFSLKEIDVLDKFSQFGLIAAREAINDANIQWTDELKQNTCIITGSSIGGQDTQQTAFYDLYVKGRPGVNLFTIPRVMPNAAASHISMAFGITGF